MSSLATVWESGTTGAPNGASNASSSNQPAFTPFRFLGDSPGPRCGHTLTHVKSWTSDGKDAPKLVLFGGVTEKDPNSPPSVPGIRATADVHVLDISTCTLKILSSCANTPSARVAHAATAVGSMVIVHGGIGPTGLASNHLHVLDFKSSEPEWTRIIIPGEGPGYRYGHVLVSVSERFLLCLGGNDGRKFLNDVWQLDIADRPYKWTKLEPKGQGPPPFMYSSGSVTSDGFLLLHGGIVNKNREPLLNTYQMTGLRSERSEWTVFSDVPASPKHHHAAAVICNSHLFVVGGINTTDKEQTSPNVAVFNKETPSWIQFSDKLVGKRHKHAAACVGETIFVYGGLNGNEVLGDFLSSSDVRPNFSYEDLKKATEDFSVDQKRGTGACGSVYLAVLKPFGKLAIKKVIEDGNIKNEMMNGFEDELKALSRVYHKNLVRLYGNCRGEDKGQEILLLVLEFAENGSLRSWMDEIPTKEWKQVVRIIHGIAEGLNYLHNELIPPIVHRDIKPENILLFQEGGQIVPKIADFGLAKIVDKKGNNTWTFSTDVICGTPGYLDPSYFFKFHGSRSLDVYAFGVIILELLTGLHPSYLPDVVNRMISDDKPIITCTRLRNPNPRHLAILFDIALKCLEETDKRIKVEKILQNLNEVMEDISRLGA